MQLPHNLWSRIALAALAAGASSCAPAEPPASPGPAEAPTRPSAPPGALETLRDPADPDAEPGTGQDPTELTAQTASGDAQPLPIESCEATEGGQGQDRVDPFIDGCPYCGMG